MNTFARRDTLTRSPFAKTPQPKSPTKTSKQELGLNLEQVLGTTCNAVTRFDADLESRSFAYVAGAAVVVATVQEDDSVSQRFFRANASQTTVSRPQPANGPSTPSAVSQEMRNRFGHRAREGSPFTGTSTHDAVDSPGANSGHAKDRVKAATAVALSRGGKWLAVGESGYRPRVLVFPVTEKKSTEVPSAIISEHSFGVHAVAFDSEGRLLASLGTINDGFLHVWELDARTGATSLLASNKCTSPIRQMVWIGKSLVTVGVRFIKVWRPDEISPSSGMEHEQARGLSDPGFKPLVGRNCLLGDMLEASFTAVVALSDTQAVICSDAGDIILLDDTSKQQRLTRISIESFAITAACLDGDGHIIVTGSNGNVKRINVQSSNRSDTPISRCGTPVARRVENKTAIHTIAIGNLGNAVVTLNNRHGVFLRRNEEAALANRSYPTTREFSSHSDAILGICTKVRAKSGSTAFATWSSEGRVIVWSNEGLPQTQITIPLDQINDAYDITNELRTIAFLPDASKIISGDRYGIVRVVNTDNGQGIFEARAHSSEVTDIAVCKLKDTTYVATASRDRAVQIFVVKGDGLELLQTLDEHAGAVTKVAFVDEGRHLLSCSADRTVVVRELLDEEGSDIALYNIARTVTLKSAPTALDAAEKMTEVLVATTDRNVHRVDIGTGRVMATFKTGDNEGGDAVNLVDICSIPSHTGPSLVAGVCGSDKSVRIYSEDGTLLARDWGHTEGVTGVALLSNQDDAGQKLVSTAADGTIFMWNTQSRKTPAYGPSARAEELAMAVPTSSPLARPPLRKVISQSEMTRLRRSVVSPNEDSEPGTPSGLKSPPPSALRKRPSRLSVGQAPRLEPSTPGTSTPTHSGSPTSRCRSPSPMRDVQSPTRSTSKSPERPSPIRRQSSFNDMRRDLPTSPVKLDAQGKSLPLRPAISRARSADPSKSNDGAVESPTTMVARLRTFRRDLETKDSYRDDDADKETEAELRAELESLLRLLSARSIGSGTFTDGAAEADTDAASGGGVEVLESVEEASEVEIKAG